MAAAALAIRSAFPAEGGRMEKETILADSCLFPLASTGHMATPNSKWGAGKGKGKMELTEQIYTEQL